ncbi:hypothetical protein ATH50_1883 [Haloplanus aerogenes]|uniref:Uncharacterized protein n=1 Tax=Haloplanus aerogenes TaxID=660522 RepID=A0A3M0DAR2_9EURY|nr:hypothetical protein ATH50_1883 [Haloplanus aerogenes]
MKAALRRRDGQATFLFGALGYPLLYLASIGHLALGARGQSVQVVDDPLSRMLRQTRPFSFEPVARVAVDPVALLVSPLDIGVALVLAALVGANLAVAVVVWRSPAACGVERSAGLLASVPALLTGATCCGPAILFVVGVGTAGAGTGVLLTAVGYATPVTALLLVGSLILVTRGTAAVRTDG